MEKKKTNFTKTNTEKSMKKEEDRQGGRQSDSCNGSKRRERQAKT